MRRTCAWYDRESQLGAAVCYITWLYVVGAIHTYVSMGFPAYVFGSFICDSLKNRSISHVPSTHWLNADF